MIACRYGARIAELRDMGHGITVKRSINAGWKYTLVLDADEEYQKAAARRARAAERTGQ